MRNRCTYFYTRAVSDLFSGLAERKVRNPDQKMCLDALRLISNMSLSHFTIGLMMHCLKMAHNGTQWHSCLFSDFRWRRYRTYQPFHFPSAPPPCHPSASPPLFHLSTPQPPSARPPLSRPRLPLWKQIRSVLKYLIILHYYKSND